VLGMGAAGLVLAGVVLAGATGVVSASLLGSGGGSGALSGAFGVAGTGGGGGFGGGTGGAGGAGGFGGLVPTAAAISGIPPGMLTLYQAASVTCPGLPWTVLAAIGTVESGNGTSNLPGVHSGSNFAGAEGPMQFEPATFAAYDEPGPPGGVVPPSPYDPADAVYAAARMLCRNGASGGADLSAAVYAYNHSTTYVAGVLSLAQSYGTVPASTAGVGLVGPGSAGANAAVWALAQVGTPYIWGGETPGVGFDCSGLSQAAYKVAGISVPRVAQDQYDAGPHLAAGTTLEPGDLVFFGSGPTDVGHVGLYLGVQDGRTMMVDAPHTWATVRVEAFPATIGAAWGDEEFVGATRPGG
jgi:cell wall-associated NlpC family hydrolase